MALFVENPSCATAFPDLPSPVIAVGWNCKHKRDCCRNHHSAQHSNKKYASHFSHKLSSVSSYHYWAVGRFLRATQELWSFSVGISISKKTRSANAHRRCRFHVITPFIFSFSTTLTAVCVRVFHGKSNAAVTFADARASRQTYKNTWFIVLDGLFCYRRAAVVTMALPLECCGGCEFLRFDGL